MPTAAHLDSFTTEPGDENSPSWSRDGRWVYYTSDQHAGRHVWRIPASGGRAYRITAGGSGYRAVLSPDGTEILCARHEVSRSRRSDD